VDELYDRKWILLNKLCDTQARTLAGAKAQAEALGAFFLEESRWTKKGDQRLARNIASTLSNLARAA
jgi:hypothetical protein